MKKKMLLLVGLMLCLLLVGCGKGESEEVKKPKDVIPSVSEYFDGADISLIRDDEKCVCYFVEKTTDDMCDKYLDACKTSGFTDVTYSSTDNGFSYYINSSDGKYKLDYNLNTYNGIVTVSCEVRTDKQ